MGCLQSTESASPVIDVPSEPKPIPRGSKVYLLKQDPSVSSLGYRLRWVGLDIKEGPATDDITIAGIPVVVKASDDQGNFLYNPNTEPVKADAVNTLTTVNLILSMYRRGLTRMGVKRKLTWQWGSEPITVMPRAGEWENAYYDRSTRSLRFFYFKHPDTPDYTVYTCRSFDIVAHEAGHAILDAIKPDYILSNYPQTGALHEAFGDLTAIFGLLEQLDVCEQIIAESKCNLHQRSFFAMIGEEFGSALGQQFGLRNADENLSMDDVSTEIHDLSRVFTGAVYDILVDMFELMRDVEKYDSADLLHRTGRHLCGIFITALLNSPDRNANFKDVADKMVLAADENTIKSIIRRHFEKRKVYTSRRAMTALDPEALKRSCATIRAIRDTSFKPPSRSSSITNIPSRSGSVSNLPSGSVAIGMYPNLQSGSGSASNLQQSGSGSTSNLQSGSGSTSNLQSGSGSTSNLQRGSGSATNIKEETV